MRDMLYNQVQDRSLLTDFVFKKKSIKSVSIEYTDQTIDPKILSDYLAFFTTSEGADMLPYVYLESSELYDNLVKNNHDYYLFSDEVSLIQKNKINLSHYLSDVVNIVEIGPGSHHTIQHKTIPILNCAAKLKTYQAVDHSENYLVDACKFIRSDLPNIDVFSTEADLMQSIPIKLNKETNGKKAIMLLGSTFGNFTIHEQHHIINQFAHLMRPGDLFLLTVDTNNDETTLMQAYSNQCTHRFVKGILKYFVTINPSFAKYLTSFDILSKWNKEQNFIDISFIANKDISFNFIGYGEVSISKGQKLQGITSYKFNKNSIISLLEERGLSTIDVLMDSGKMQMFICSKR